MTSHHTQNQSRISSLMNKFLSWVGTKVGFTLWTIFTLLVIPLIIEFLSTTIKSDSNLFLNQFMPMTESADSYFQANADLLSTTYARLDAYQAIYQELTKAKADSEYQHKTQAMETQDFLISLEKAYRTDTNNLKKKIKNDWDKTVNNAKKFAVLSGLTEKYDEIAANRDQKTHSLEESSRKKMLSLMKSAKLENTKDIITMFQNIKGADIKHNSKQNASIDTIFELLENTNAMLKISAHHTSEQTQIDRQYYNQVHKLFLTRINEIHRTGPLKIILHYLN